MAIILKWIALGLFVAALVTAIVGFLQFKRKRAADAAKLNRRRVEMMQEFEQVGSSSSTKLGSAKTTRTGAEGD